MPDRVTVTLPDGSSKEVPAGTRIIDFVREQIGPGLAKAAYIARLDGEPVDLSRAIDRDARLEVVTTRSPEALEVARHDAAHVMASVVQRLYPGTQVTIGPAVEDGFYYDFAREQPFTPEDLARIEQGIAEEIAADHPFVRDEISAEAAVGLFEAKGEHFKVEIVKDIAARGARTLTLYRHGDWVDFCLGPHGPSTGRLGVVKLMNVAGAYWRGDPKNPMLQRIYGTQFFDRKALDAYLKQLEEARKRDHRKLGPALGLFESRGEHFKVEIVKDIAAKGARSLTLYRHGDWVDFCLGPHGPSTGRLGVVKLMSVAGAYWRGDPKNPMLQRIYGTQFFDRKALDAYLKQLEEARKRDHRKLGPALGLFTFHEYAPGAAFWLPHGTTVFNVLREAMARLVNANGYQEVKTPLLFNKRLWETSGHWGKYRENMFLVLDSETDPALPLEERFTQSLKPMNCPSHHLIYRMGKRSYRELPIRYYTTDVLHRNEASGSLGGLTRVRQFQQDDSHIYLMESQVGEEVARIVELMKRVYGAFDLSFSARFSTRPEVRIGDDALWDRAEAALRTALESLGLAYTLNPGDGAFYGPKIDFAVTDSLGRTWQLCTIQLDYMAPERFDLSYVGDDNREHRPVVIHRAIYGSFERFIAILTEHYAGSFPAWLAPVQARVVTVSDRFNGWGAEVVERLAAAGWRAELDHSSEKLGAKIRNAQLAKIPFTLVVGEKEVEARAVAPRRHGGEDLKSMPLEAFLELMRREAAAPF